MTLPSAILVAHRAQIVELVTKNRLAAIYHHSLFSEAGGLLFYGVTDEIRFYRERANS